MSFLSKFNFPSWLTSFLQNHLLNNPIYQKPLLRNILFTIGATYLLSKAFTLTKGLFSFFQSPIDLIARYGKNTWALVTGASDGVGKAFAFELARRGFNVVLVGRNKEKLESVERELKATYASAETKIVVEDFVNAWQEDFAQRIYDQVVDLDISILVNNAATGSTKVYVETPLEKIREVVIVNCMSPALITRVFLPKLAARNQRSAIVNISSFSSYTPVPGIQVYSASKIFLHFLSRGLAYEHPEIDIISLRPAGMSTAMIGYRKPDFDTVLPEQAVKSGLEALGRTEETPGHWKHKRRLWIMNLMPEFYRDRYLKKRYIKK